MGKVRFGMHAYTPLWIIILYLVDFLPTFLKFPLAKSCVLDIIMLAHGEFSILWQFNCGIIMMLSDFTTPCPTVLNSKVHTYHLKAVMQGKKIRDQLKVKNRLQLCSKKTFFPLIIHFQQNVRLADPFTGILYPYHNRFMRVHHHTIKAYQTYHHTEIYYVCRDMHDK